MFTEKARHKELQQHAGCVPSPTCNQILMHIQLLLTNTQILQDRRVRMKTKMTYLSHHSQLRYVIWPFIYYLLTYFHHR